MTGNSIENSIHIIRYSSEQERVHGLDTDIWRSLSVYHRPVSVTMMTSDFGEKLLSGSDVVCRMFPETWPWAQAPIESVTVNDQHLVGSVKLAYSQSWSNLISVQRRISHENLAPTRLILLVFISSLHCDRDKATRNDSQSGARTFLMISRRVKVWSEIGCQNLDCLLATEKSWRWLFSDRQVLPIWFIVRNASKTK